MDSNTVSLLKKNGYEGEARAFVQLIKDEPLPISQDIPSFSYSSRNHVTGVINSIKLRQSIAFLSSITLNQLDIDTIQQELQTISHPTRLISTIHWETIISKFPQQKSFYFDKEILQKFTRKRKFRSKKFVKFLHLVSLLQQAMKTLFEIDPSHPDTVSFSTLEKFISLYVDRLQCLKVLSQDLSYFRNYYIQYVVSHMNFFLTPVHNTPITHRDLFCSDLFAMFVNMEEDLSGSDSPNPYKLRAATMLYNEFINLDKAKNYVLTKEDIVNYEGHKFTDAFLDRLFETVPTQNDTMDYFQFVQFSLAMRNMTSPVAAKYFFSVFDIDGDNLLSQQDLFYFYKGIKQEIEIDVSFELLFTTLIDLCGAKESIDITQFSDSDSVDQIIRFMIDAEEFSKYDDGTEQCNVM